MNAKDFFRAIIPQLARFVQKNFFQPPDSFRTADFFCRVLTNELCGGYAIQNSASSVRVSSFHVVRADSFKNFCKEVKRMPESDKKIKHVIVSRFFPQQDPRYPYNIFDVDFLSKQLNFAKNNALKSLENQTNKNFEFIFLVNEKFFSDPKYEFIFTELRNCTSLPLKFVKTHQAVRGIAWMYTNTEMPSLIKEMFNHYDFVIQSALDFDDFIYKDAIADTQSKVNECNGILSYGYCKGYTYFNGELSPYRQLFNGMGHHSMLQSLILKSSFAKNLPFIGIHSFVHTKFKPGMKEFLEKNGVAFSEDMFQQNASTNAFIYFRHKFSHNNLVTDPGHLDKFSKRRKITNEDITKEQLADEFGFHYELNSIE